MSGDVLADVLLVASRLVWYAGIVGVIGACAFRLLRSRLQGPHLPDADGTTAAAGVIAAAVLLAGVLARLYAQAYVSFGLEEPLTPSLLWLVASDLPPWSTGWQLQLAASVAALGAFLWRRGGRPAWGAACVAAAAIAASAPLTGHAVAQPDWTMLPIAMQAGHVLGAGTWIGGLFVLTLVALRTRGERDAASAAPRLVEAFSPVALAAAGLLVLTGLTTVVLYLTAPADLWTTGYGRTLLLKLALFAAVAAAGFANWRILRPRLLAGGGIGPLRRSARVELALAAIVLLVTAVLVGLPQPGE